MLLLIAYFHDCTESPNLPNPCYLESNLEANLN